MKEEAVGQPYVAVPAEDILRTVLSPAFLSLTLWGWDGMLSRALELKRDQILVLVMKDFKLKYDSTALGFFWSLMVPVFSSLIYLLVFGFMMRWNIKNYLLYLLSGTFLWHFFTNTVMANGKVLLSNASLLKKTNFDRRLLVWGTFFSEGTHFLLTLPILAVIMLSYGVIPNWLSFFPNVAASLLFLTFFAMGFSYMYAAVNLHLRDLERVMRLIMQVWFYLTPVFIPENRIPAKYLWIYTVNPMAGIVRCWRDAFYEPAFHPERWPLLALISICVFWAGRALFLRLEATFAERM